MNDNSGSNEAMRLAWTLFVEDMSMKEFTAMSMEDQVALAENAGLDADGLLRVLRYMSAYQGRRAEALKDWNATRSGPDENRPRA